MSAKKIVRTTTETTFIVDSFPKDTDEMYIIGSVPELGNWDISKAVKMQYYQNENTNEQFIATFELPKTAYVEYKYLNHADWKNVECGFVAEEVANRTITLKGTKTREVVDEVKGFRI